MSSFNNFQKKGGYYKYNKNSKNKIYEKERERYRRQQEEKLQLELEEERKKEKNLDLSNNEIFPSLVKNNKYKLENNTLSNNITITNFNKLKLQILNDNIENSLYENSLYESTSNTTQNKNGWLILNKENIDKYKEKKEIEKNLQDSNSNSVSTNDIYSCYNKLCIHWNNYRDEINYLLGDRSLYFNYKNEIENLIFEENQILEEIYGNINYYSSDDEHNDYENDDFYYFK